MAEHRLVDRFTGHDEQHRIAIRLDYHALVLPRQPRDLGLVNAGPCDGHMPGKHRNHAGVALGQWQRHLRTRIKADVPKIQGREGAGWASDIPVLARDDARPPTGKSDLTDLVARDSLVFRWRSLIARGQIDPQLDHAEGSAGLRKAGRMELLVHHARSGGHPLDLSRADGAPAAGGIAVADFAVIYDRHGLEALVGMFPDTPGASLGRFEPPWSGIIEQQERADRSGIAVIAEQGSYREAIADPMAAIAAKNGL